jgi:hypothetical protein
MEPTCSAETSVDFQRATRRYITYHNHRYENPKSYLRICIRVDKKDYIVGIEIGKTAHLLQHTFVQYLYPSLLD